MCLNKNSFLLLLSSKAKDDLINTCHAYPGPQKTEWCAHPHTLMAEVCIKES